MCGRFQVGLRDDACHLPEGFARWLAEHPEASGGIVPSRLAPVMTARGLTAMRFGMKPSFMKRLLINARSETAAQSPLFAPLMKASRCLVVASAFCEWTPDKKPRFFALLGHACLYMAGLYSLEGPEPGFVILTREAEGAPAAVHPRMPLILGSPELREAWLHQDALAEALPGLPASALHAPLEPASLPEL